MKMGFSLRETAKTLTVGAMVFALFCVGLWGICAIGPGGLLALFIIVGCFIVGLAVRLIEW